MKKKRINAFHRYSLTIFLKAQKIDNFSDTFIYSKIPHLVAFLYNLIVRFFGVLMISSSFLSKSSCCLISSSILGFSLNLTVFNKLFSNEDAKICPASISTVESPIQIMLVINCYKRKNYVRVLARV
jgi:hypothetical protein